MTFRYFIALAAFAMVPALEAATAMAEVRLVIEPGPRTFEVLGVDVRPLEGTQAEDRTAVEVTYQLRVVDFSGSREGWTVVPVTSIEAGVEQGRSRYVATPAELTVHAGGVSGPMGEFTFEYRTVFTLDDTGTVPPVSTFFQFL